MSAPSRVETTTQRDSWLRRRLETLRLRIHRKVLWLRANWESDPLQSYHGLVISDIQANRLLGPSNAAAEANFYAQDPQAVVLTMELARTEAEEQPPDTPLATLAARFGLTWFEQEALFLIAAPWLDGTFHQLYAYVQDDLTRRLASPGLAVSLLLGPEDDAIRAAARFSPAATLLRHALVVPTGTAEGLEQALTVDHRIADYFRGVDEIDARLFGMSTGVTTGLHVEMHAVLAASIVAWFRSHPNHVVNLYGRPDSGQRELALEVSSALGLDLIEIDAARLAAAPERDVLLTLLARDAKLSSLAIFANVHDAAAEMMASLRAPVFIATRERWQGPGHALYIDVARPNAQTRTDLWRQALPNGDRIASAIGAAVEQFDLGPGGIEAAAALARASASNGAGSEPEASAVWEACRELSRREMGDLVQHIDPRHEWADLVLPPDVLDQLNDIADHVLYRAVVYQTWGLGSRLSRGRGITALFAGASGTGKTLAAEVLAARLHVDLYRVDLASVVDKYIGETEKRLRQLFDTAEQAGAMLLLDESDALAGKRTDVRDSHDRYANISVSYLLQRMEEYAGLIVLATNRRADMDRAFLRRLRFVIEFPFPDASQRRSIWARILPPDAPIGDLDMEALSRLEIAGGSIHNVVLNACFQAAAEGEPIGMNHVMRAAAREYTKINKLVTETQFGEHYKVVGA